MPRSSLVELSKQDAETSSTRQNILVQLDTNKTFAPLSDGIKRDAETSSTRQKSQVQLDTNKALLLFSTAQISEVRRLRRKG
jgi:hypothetical protein